MALNVIRTAVVFFSIWMELDAMTSLSTKYVPIISMSHVFEITVIPWYAKCIFIISLESVAIPVASETHHDRHPPSFLIVCFVESGESTENIVWSLFHMPHACTVFVMWSSPTAKILLLACSLIKMSSVYCDLSATCWTRCSYLYPMPHGKWNCNSRK